MFSKFDRRKTMNRFDTFTKHQQDTYTKMHDLAEEYMKAFDPTTFVYNEKAAKIKQEMEAVRSKCNHIFENGECIVCGMEETK